MQTAREMLYWHRDFQTVRSGSFENGDIAWFPEGGINASYNCVDRWAHVDPDRVSRTFRIRSTKIGVYSVLNPESIGNPAPLTLFFLLQTAIIYEADEPSDSREISYGELLREVSRVANVLKSFGVKKGDTVSIYLPMTWHAVAAFLACARIGAIHSVVFAGFSAESLRDRVQDCECRVVITADEGKRGGKTIATKAIVDSALKECPLVEHVLVLARTGKEVPWTPGRDKWWHEETVMVPSYCPPEILSSEDPLFILYVSVFSVFFADCLSPNPYHPRIIVTLATDLWLDRQA